MSEARLRAGGVGKSTQSSAHAAWGGGGWLMTTSTGDSADFKPPSAALRQTPNGLYCTCTCYIKSNRKTFDRSCPRGSTCTLVMTRRGVFTKNEFRENYPRIFFFSLLKDVR